MPTSTDGRPPASAIRGLFVSCLPRSFSAAVVVTESGPEAMICDTQQVWISLLPCQLKVTYTITAETWQKFFLRVEEAPGRLHGGLLTVAGHLNGV
jgi:hypothetical protein